MVKFFIKNNLLQGAKIKFLIVDVLQILSYFTEMSLRSHTPKS